eukprot:GCRY01002605.1.p1 GENE.GCRY01002605.1~~GCRY01002605.1.p1  ORF type:complete len:395 (-),score=18.50 GCRY01002605.1:2-1186(-)
MNSKVPIIFGLHFAVLLYFYTHAFWCFSETFGPGSLFVVADPQMEGEWREASQGTFGKLNNYFNDLYMRFVFSSTVSRATQRLQPIAFKNTLSMKQQQLLCRYNVVNITTDYVSVVLGDLFSHYSISDFDFQKRLNRYNYIFSNPLSDESSFFHLNITGNHDIGYEQQVTNFVFERFSRTFGSPNKLYYYSNHIIAVINSICLDGPASNPCVQESWEHLERVSKLRPSFPVVLLTHIPLFKPDDACVDDYFFQTNAQGRVIEQTFLTRKTTNTILNKVRPNLILTGHDHFGCHYCHQYMLNGTEVTVEEYTFRALQAEFGGFSAAVKWELDTSSSPQDFVYIVSVCQFVTHLTLAGYFGTVAFCIILGLGFQMFKILKRLTNILTRKPSQLFFN